jgi:glycosyltransferase involved in cell wall biosynthesis
LPALDLAANAVLVVGMTSLLLYEAAIIGVPVLSYQPNRNLVSDVTDGRPGIFVVTKPDELDDAIDLLCRSRSPSPITFDPAMATATRRFFSFLDKLSLQNDTLESHCV